MMPTQRWHRFDAALRRQSPALVWAAAVALTAGLAFIDFATGYEISFSLFYVLPIAFVAWHAGGRAAFVFSVAAAVAWEEANRLAGQVYSSPSIPMWNALTRLGFFLTITFLLLKLKQMLAREQALSRTDALTGVCNRRAFDEEAHAALARAKRGGQPLTVVYLDLDDFKAVNDRLGHAIGDRVLGVVAETLRDSVRATDTVARLGGDEFGLLLPGTDEGAAGALVAKLHGRLVEAMAQHHWHVGVSAGALICRTTPESVDAMIGLADALMYEVKSGGKNAIRLSIHGG